MSTPVEDRPHTCDQCRAVYRKAFERCPRDGGKLAPLESDPLEGVTFAARYIIETCVGEGAMGRVYKARHVRMSRKFAVKVMYGDLAADPKMRARFEHEAEAASRLDHPNVISVTDFGETTDGLFYLVMDFIEGQDLADVIQAGPVPPKEVVELGKGICAGLQHAHERGLIHRDLKLENVVVVENEDLKVPKIVDFGIAKLREPDEEESRLTAAGCVVGTPAYMSPEQACGEPIDARSDLFSLGLIIYELLAGKKPFDGSALEIARKNVSKKPPPIRERNPDVQVHPDLEKLIMRMLEKRAEDRQASAQEVLEALERIGDSVDVGADDPLAAMVAAASEAPTTIGPPPPPPGRADGTQEAAAAARSRAPLALGIGVAALLLVLLGFGLLDDEGTKAEPMGSEALVVDFPAEGKKGPGDTTDEIAGQGDPADGEPSTRSPKKTTKKKRTPTRTQEPRTTPPPAVPPPAPPAPPPPPPEVADVSTSDFIRAYAEVGKTLDRLERGGDADIAQLSKTYRGIGFNDAMKNPTLRKVGYQKLLKIQKALAAR